MSRARRPTYPFVIALLAALAAGCGSAASAGDRISSVPVVSADEASSLQQRFVSIVKGVSPEVVQIRTPVALGSGVVFDARGDVVTNAHVVGSATRFVVTLDSGDSHPATLVGRDVATDLAVDTHSRSASASRDLRRFGAGPGRRPHTCDREPARAALERDRGHRLGHRAQRAGNRQRDSFLGHPDQRGDQPGELGRRARGPLRSRDRDSYPRSARSRNGRRGTRHRLRYRQQHRAPDRDAPY